MESTYSLLHFVYGNQHIVERLILMGTEHVRILLNFRTV